MPIARWSQALRELRVPWRVTAEYDYVMTARLHLSLFWAGKDDVGGGYNRWGISTEDGTTEVYQILMAPGGSVLAGVR
jgi:hypothetical protein